MHRADHLRRTAAAAMKVAETCSITVAGGGPLASTGPDAAALVLLVGATVLAIVIGVALLDRRRRRAAVVGGAAALMLVAAFVAAPAPAASAAPAGAPCSLMGISDIERADTAAAGNLLPGDEVIALAYTITNPTTFPIKLTIDTATGNTEAAAHFTARLTGPGETSEPLTTGPLANLPATPEVTLAPGDSTRLAYTVAVSPDADNLAQGLQVDFTSIITATGP